MNEQNRPGIEANSRDKTVDDPLKRSYVPKIANIFRPPIEQPLLSSQENPDKTKPKKHTRRDFLGISRKDTNKYPDSSDGSGATQSYKFEKHSDHVLGQTFQTLMNRREFNTAVGVFSAALGLALASTRPVNAESVPFQLYEITGIGEDGKPVTIQYLQDAQVPPEVTGSLDQAKNLLVEKIGNSTAKSNFRVSVVNQPEVSTGEAQAIKDAEAVINARPYKLFLTVTFNGKPYCTPIDGDPIPNLNNDMYSSLQNAFPDLQELKFWKKHPTVGGGTVDMEVGACNSQGIHAPENRGGLSDKQTELLLHWFGIVPVMADLRKKYEEYYKEKGIPDNVGGFATSITSIEIYLDTGEDKGMVEFRVNKEGKPTSIVVHAGTKDIIAAEAMSMICPPPEFPVNPPFEENWRLGSRSRICNEVISNLFDLEVLNLEDSEIDEILADNRVVSEVNTAQMVNSRALCGITGSISTSFNDEEHRRLIEKPAVQMALKILREYPEIKVFLRGIANNSIVIDDEKYAEQLKIVKNIIALLQVMPTLVFTEQIDVESQYWEKVTEDSRMQQLYANLWEHITILADNKALAKMQTTGGAQYGTLRRQSNLATDYSQHVLLTDGGSLKASSTGGNITIDGVEIMPEPPQVFARVPDSYMLDITGWCIFLRTGDNKDAGYIIGLPDMFWYNDKWWGIGDGIIVQPTTVHDGEKTMTVNLIHKDLHPNQWLYEQE